VKETFTGQQFVQGCYMIVEWLGVKPVIL